MLIIGDDENIDGLSRANMIERLEQEIDYTDDKIEIKGKYLQRLNAALEAFDYVLIVDCKNKIVKSDLEDAQVPEGWELIQIEEEDEEEI